MKNKIFLAIDFDATIADKINDVLVLKENAKEALQALKDANCFILIDSTRANPYRKKPETVEKSLAEMKNFLDLHGIPYDMITGISFPARGKPIADFYVGDKHINFTSWKEIVKNVINIEI